MLAFLGSVGTFLGGAAFRMIWGELSSILTKWQDHRFEMDRMEKQEKIDAANHARMLETIDRQTAKQIEIVQAQAESVSRGVEDEAWLARVRAVGMQTGIKFIDAWNGVITPLMATIALVLIALQVVKSGLTIDERTWDLLSCALGLYIADRRLQKRGK